MTERGAGITVKYRTEDSLSKPFAQRIVLLLASAVRAQGMVFNPEHLLPMKVGLNGNSEYARGVLSMVLEVYYLASQTTEGRQAILDLGFEPFFEKVSAGTKSQECGSDSSESILVLQTGQS